MKNLIKTKAKKGFSLVELLVVIAVIGIIAAIAIPAMSGVFQNSTDAKNKRNAQNVASIYSSYRAAGGSTIGTDKTAIVTALETGLNGSGAFSTTKFATNLGAAKDDALTKLTYVEATDSFTVNQ